MKKFDYRRTDLKKNLLFFGNNKVKKKLISSTSNISKSHYLRCSVVVSVSRIKCNFMWSSVRIPFFSSYRLFFPRVKINLFFSNSRSLSDRENILLILFFPRSYYFISNSTAHIVSITLLYSFNIIAFVF